MIINKDKQKWLTRIRLIYCCLFLGACFLPLIGSLTGIKTPNLEKRRLAAKPQLVTSQSLNLDFTSQFDAYFADNFTFRTYFISGWHRINQLLLQQSGNERVILGKNGWLFFQDTLDDYMGTNRMDSIALLRLDRILHLQQDWLAGRGIGWIFTVAPNKNSIYPQMMPLQMKPINPAGNLDLLKPLLADNQYLDLEELLFAAAIDSQEPIYHRTDSHWNNYGARIAAEKILKAAGRSIPEINLETPADAPHRLVRDWTGDLAVMMDPAGPEADWQFRYEGEAGYNYEKTINSLEDIWIGTKSSNGHGSLLMFRDSFANALIPLLSESFARAVYSRAVPFDYGLVEKEQPDLVIFEIVERNLPQILLKPPRMTADTLADDAPLVKDINVSLTELPINLSADEISLQISNSGNWLKISGLWPDGFLQQSVDRVLIGLQSAPIESAAANSITAGNMPVTTYYEASPVADIGISEWQKNGGFTIYLEQGKWQAGFQPLRVYLHAKNQWLQTELEVDLP